MSLYDEQIRQRCKIDDEMLEASFAEAQNALTGRSFSLHGNYPETAIGQILWFFKVSTEVIPDDSMSPDQAMEAAFESAGIMRRNVLLYNDWYDNTWGVYLASIKATGEVVAIIPKGVTKLYYYDNASKKYVRIRKKNASMFAKEAICLYRPFPARSLTLGDVFSFGISSCSKGDAIFALALLLLATILGLLTPKISYFMFSQVATLKSLSLLMSTFVFGVLTGIASVVIINIYGTMTSRIGTKIRLQISSATMMRILTLPIDFFTKHSAGDISNRVENVQDFCIRIISEVIVTGLTAVFSLAYFSQVIVYAPTLAPTVALIIVISLLFFILSARYQYKVSKIQLELNAKSAGLSYDTITGIEKIKLAGAEKRLFARYAKSFAETAKVAYNPPLIIKLNAPIAACILLVGQFIIYYTAIKTNVGYAEYYAFMTAYASIAAALTVLAATSVGATNIVGQFAMIKPITETAPEVNEKLKSVTGLKGIIELNNVSFRYDGANDDIIKNMSLKIRAGEYVAIVGKSGCGKSTLVRLLLGFITPRMGAIYYDGKDLNTLEKSSLRRKIGVVMQSDGLFNGSIYANITVSVPGASIDVAWKAAEVAGIADDIKKMPMGMHTVIGEGSGGFSGGQKQRLMIARAVAPDPRIIIFDEATSALDNRTQRQVCDALDALNCTKIIIAHRLSTIKNCDRILFMEDGKIVEEGTYDELISSKGRFADMVDRQRLDK